jgi:hypothetical protein
MTIGNTTSAAVWLVEDAAAVGRRRLRITQVDRHPSALRQGPRACGACHLLQRVERIPEGPVKDRASSAAALPDLPAASSQRLHRSFADCKFIGATSTKINVHYDSEKSVAVCLTFRRAILRTIVTAICPDGSMPCTPAASRSHPKVAGVARNLDPASVPSGRLVSVWGGDLCALPRWHWIPKPTSRSCRTPATCTPSPDKMCPATGKAAQRFLQPSFC